MADDNAKDIPPSDPASFCPLTQADAYLQFGLSCAQCCGWVWITVAQAFFPRVKPKNEQPRF
jgi:hypothetical protein